MGEVEIDASILEKTRKDLGAIIKTPKLSDRLLKKPPFRFLHDIVTNVIKATQFATQLYTEDELDSSKCTEKDAKVFFLQKVISSVNYTLKLDPPLAAKPIKIVSGLEPEHTNTFLQELARATKVPKEKSDKAIAKVLQKLAEKQKAAAAKKDDKPKDTKPPQPSAPPAPDEKEKAAEMAKPSDDEQAKKEEEEKASKAAAAAAAAAPSAAERPGTALKAPPPQTSNVETQEPRTVGASRRKDKDQDAAPAPVGVIVDDKKDKKKGGAKGTLDTDSEGDEEAQDEAFSKIDPSAQEGGAEGYLARMAQAQKEEEMQKLEAAKLKQEQADPNQTESSDGIRLRDTRGGKDRKEREVFSTEVSKLRDSIKLVVKAAMPLGQTFDYVQEDIDSMAKEYMSWKRQAQDTKVQFQEIERTTGEQLQPLHTQLQELEDAINDQLNKIHTVKANILKNDQTIETLLRMVINSK